MKTCGGRRRIWEGLDVGVGNFERVTKISKFGAFEDVFGFTEM